MTRATQKQGGTGWPDRLLPNLQLFLSYWQQLSDAAGGIPPRSSVDPLDIPIVLLPGMGLLHWQPKAEGGGRLLYRLLGTAHRRATGRDFTGQYFDAIFPPDEVARMEEEYRAILDSGQPHFARRASLQANHEFITYQRIVAPLLDESGQPRHLIGYWFWEGLDT